MFFPPSRNDSRGKVFGGRGGRSKVELSAQEELAKAREERERRKRQKLEQKSAVVIQAAWRGWSSRYATRQAAKSTWSEQYGVDGDKLQAKDCLTVSAGGALGRLLRFYRPEADCKPLASVARAVASAVRTDAFAAFISSYNVSETRASLLYQVKALALQCLLTLSEHRRQVAPVLAAARPSNPLDPAAGGVAGALTECLLLLVSPDPYTPSLGKSAATSLAAAVLGHLAGRGMCTHLFHLLIAAFGAAAPPHPHPPPHPVAAKPYVEALTTQLTVRLLALRAFSPAAPGDSLHVLLCVPNLWRRCSSLAPVSGRMTRAAVTWLAAAGPERLGALLPPRGGYSGSGGGGLPGGAGAAVAVLLANMLAVGPRLLEPDKAPVAAAAAPAAGQSLSGGSAQRSLALAVVRVLHAVVSLLPLQPFFPDPSACGGGGGVDDSDDEVDEAAAGSLGLARLVLPPGAAAALPGGLVEAVQGLTGAPGRQLIKQLVAVLLPLTGTGPQQPPQLLHGTAAAGGLAFPGAGFPPPAGLPQLQPFGSGGGPGSFARSSSPPALYPYGYLGGSPPAGGGAAGSLQRISSPSGGSPHALFAPQHQPFSPLPLPSSSPSSTLLDAAESAHALCEFLWQLAQLPGQQQRVLLGAAVSADLVQRMWWSFLRPARQADLAGLVWLPEEAGTAAAAAGAAGPRGGGASGGSTRAPCSASSSFHCSGPVPMEVELPAGAVAGVGVGVGPAANGSAWGGGGAQSRSGSACMLIDGGGGGGEGGGGLAGGGSGGGGGGGSWWRPRLSEDVGWLLPLAVTCSAFSVQVATSTLEEFYGGAQRPLPLVQLYDTAAPEAGFLAMLRDALWQVLWSDGQTDRTAAGDALYAVLARTGGLLYGILYERNCRRAFCPTEAFHATALAPDWFFTEANSSRSHAGREDGSSRVWQVLRHAPYLVPFADRARLFQQMVAKERQDYLSQEENRFLEMGALDGNRFVQIRRDRLLFDGFDNLNSLGERLRGRVRIMFIDAHGAPEAGVDGGGLFKDFMEELMRAGLSAEYGLFAANTAQQLFPNPGAMRLVEDAARLLAFLGRMLGKAMYENILLELPLAGFFLKKFRGAHCDLNDLPTLDPELYCNLLKLREHFAAGAAAASSSPAAPEGSSQQGGEAAAAAAAAAMDLGLTFVVADDAAAAVGDPGAEVELKPGGRHISVTADNVNEYIHRVAHYKLNLSPRPAVSAFLSGFYELIPRSWVSMFSGEELQTLISGADSERGGLDLEDMRQHVVYAGGYHEDHPVILVFWEVLSSFSPEEQAKLLKFVTSCSRAPLLGFKFLEPPLCLQMSGAMLDPSAPQRLPTASTCMNLLKLPPYRTHQAMRDKLIYAINSGAGFDLS
ncbi:hypothetical protein PLESTB_001224100 [Pleodorina starrii]|uniref:HECT-type E3 ubiquitin transferase n=1 Tax=Pleodorina starrii TaxID=330485 RepID=A0A9W6F5W5_9CHLO|nr:hypothetical protein PLESTB_001224100 [Pleodorina starrii]